MTSFVNVGSRLELELFLLLSSSLDCEPFSFDSRLMDDEKAVFASSLVIISMFYDDRFVLVN